jgi:hypothetical protein
VYWSELELWAGRSTINTGIVPEIVSVISALAKAGPLYGWVKVTPAP